MDIVAGTRVLRMKMGVVRRESKRLRGEWGSNLSPSV